MVTVGCAEAAVADTCPGTLISETATSWGRATSSCFIQLRIFWFCRKAKLSINYKNCSLVARMVISVKVTQHWHSHTCLLSKRKASSNSHSQKWQVQVCGIPLCVCCSGSIHHKTRSRMIRAQHTQQRVQPPAHAGQGSRW